jgi:hypothetical protein
VLEAGSASEGAEVGPARASTEVSVVVVEDRGVSMLRVVLDPGIGTPVTCTCEDPAAELVRGDPGSAAWMFSVSCNS